jgi:hypothetical protein
MDDSEQTSAHQSDTRTVVERRADAVNAVLGVALTGVLIALYAQQVAGESIGYRLEWLFEHRWAPAFRRWRHEMFGAPRLTDEQMREAERQVMIEARRVLRSAS